jgi:hypothetical protein
MVVEMVNADGVARVLSLAYIVRTSLLSTFIYIESRKI